jgi:LuxR family transcriptional regulator, maltose regulon positive regulatory protein
VKSKDAQSFVVDSRLLDRMSADGPQSSRKPSPRQMEILYYLAAGQSHRAIGDTLGISQATVDRHVANLYINLRVSSRQQAIDRARELGWLDSPPQQIRIP